MPDTDPYRFTSTAPSSTPTYGSASTSADTSDGITRADVARTLLWAVVVISAVTNMALSYGGSATAPHLAAGIVTVLSAGTLVVRRLRGRRK
ncbi:hypothetical protein [Streptomyces pseudovenezuelae]|uniref:Holin n=1 Tax=Streptomyces pseudovenezuelae TaxID=67350 RepID=A0ABT6LH07_9ACTN|nr:hypothetical protein [Streptomyces pseudovenezuelae]MDH6214916.1 hypothetical protein [Streptomyces pseudovenezuelae]